MIKFSKIAKVLAAALCGSLLVCYPVMAETVTQTTSYDGYSFKYTLSWDENSRTALTANAVYGKVDTGTEVTVNITGYQFKISSPLTVNDKSASKTQTANGPSSPAVVVVQATSGYEFYRANTSYTVRNSSGYITKNLSESI